MERYYSIYAFMVDMGLKGAQLQVFALIFSFCRAGGKMMMKQDDIAKRVGYSVRAVEYALQKLCSKNLIVKSSSPTRADCVEFIVSDDIKNEFLDDNENQNLNNEESSAPQECKNCTTEVQKLQSSYAKTAEQIRNNCSTDTQKLPTYNKLYNKDNSKEDNKLYNTISPNGESESDIVESENGDECYCEADNAQCEIIFGGNNADNTVNAEGNKKSAGGKKKGNRAGNKQKGKENAEQNSKAEPPSRELSTQKNNKNRLQEKFDKFWAAYPRHIDKAKALKAFTKINPDDELLEQMLNNINEAKKTTQWQTPQYIPYPTTWLNGSRWEDEIDPKDIDKDIAHTLDNPIDRAVANGEDISDLWDW